MFAGYDFDSLKILPLTLLDLGKRLSWNLVNRIFSPHVYLYHYTILTSIPNLER